MSTDIPIDVFLSIPYGGGNDRKKAKWEIISKAIMNTKKYYDSHKLRINRAKDKDEAPVLNENVKEQIQQCDFLMAVIDKQNLNIMWEIGFAAALKKPIVYLVHEQNMNKIPVLINSALVVSYNNEMLKEIVRKKELSLFLKKKLKAFFDMAITRVKANYQPPKVHPNRSLCNIPEIVANATRRIRLITTNMSYFANEKAFAVPNPKNPKKNSYAFDIAVDNGVEIDILVLDPESLIIKYRAEQIKFANKVGKYRDELKKGARKFYQKYHKKDNVNINLYDDLPLQITLMADEIIVTSLMSRGIRGRECIHLELTKLNDGAIETFERHFHDVNGGITKPISNFVWATKDYARN